MVYLAGKATSEAEGEKLIRHALTSGAAVEKLRAMIKGQGGDPAVIDDYGKFPKAKASHHVTAHRAGFVSGLDALFVGQASVALGAGRDKKGDPVDLSAGIRIVRKPGEAVAAGEPVLELLYNDDARLPNAIAIAKKAITIDEVAPPPASLVLGWVHADGETMFAPAG